MYHPRLKGSYYDMGFRNGSLLAKHGFKLPAIEEKKIRFGLESYKELEKIFPEMTFEIKGFAEGAKICKEKLIGLLLSIGAFEHEVQCSVFAITNGSKTLVGRNFDFLYKFQRFTESSLICPEGKYSYISHSDIFIGREDGLNEKGLFIANTFVNGQYPRPGIDFLFAIRYILEHCSSTEEVIKFFHEVPISTYNNFLVADRQGDIVVIEACPYKVALRRPAASTNYIVCTNEFMEPEMKLLSSPGSDWSMSKQRYESLSDYLKAKDEISIEEAKHLLSDKKTCVCLDLKEPGFGTLWSVVAELQTLNLYRAEGQPKGTNYKQDKRLQDFVNKKDKNYNKRHQKIK